MSRHMVPGQLSPTDHKERGTVAESDRKWGVEVCSDIFHHGA
jgi:hypothetical protein